MVKTVYGWVAVWPVKLNAWGRVAPNVTVDLFFSSREKFEELLGWSNMDKEILVPVEVPEEFEDLDYIPENY